MWGYLEIRRISGLGTEKFQSGTAVRMRGSHYNADDISRELRKVDMVGVSVVKVLSVVGYT